MAPKKKLSKKERQKLESERAEKARIEAELEAARQIEIEKKRRAEELRLAKENDIRLNFEQKLRIDQLTNSVNAINTITAYNYELNLENKKEKAWQQYLKCDGLPDPSNCAQMNTYLHLWEQLMDKTTFEKTAHRNNETVQILEELEDFIHDPLDATEKQVEDWKWIRCLFREYQQANLDIITYKLLRNIDKNLNRLDIPRADYHKLESNYSINLFAMVQLPTPVFNPRAPARPPIHLDFANMNMIVQFPSSVDCLKMAIRSMYLKYDNLSDTSSNYNCPTAHEEFKKDLLNKIMDEWYAQMRYKYDNRKMGGSEEGEEQPAEVEMEILDPKDIPVVPYQKLDPTPFDYVIQLDDKLYKQIRENMLISVEASTINLRKYVVLGGLYFLNLYYQPPQCKEIVSYETKLSVLHISKSLREVPFHVSYTPTPPFDPNQRRTPEEIEEEMKKQEEELDKLMFITLTVPENVMWLDIPVVCCWNNENKIWTTDDIHDTKHVEEKGYITFRTGKFGTFGLASYRYINMPYQTWEVKPEIGGTIIFQLTCAILMIEFTLKENLLCISQLQNSPNNSLQEIIGQYMSLSKLKRIMRSAGVDVFPEYDAFSYIEGTTCEKNYPMEKHIYFCIAQLSHIFNFAWSRWNLNAGRRNVVLQTREYKLDKPKQKTHSMVLVTPLNAQFIDCTEVSQSFNNSGIAGTKFFADLAHLVKGTSSIALRNKIEEANAKVVKGLADILVATRPLSFC